MQNTTINYFYRDGDNYKSSYQSVCLEGLLSEEDRQLLLETEFVPQFMGMAHLQPELWEHDKTDNFDEEGRYVPFGDGGKDHAFHEILGVIPTDESSDFGTATDFMTRFRTGIENNWDLPKWLDQLAEEAAYAKTNS